MEKIKTKKKFEIKNRWNGEVLYSSTKTTYREVLEEANLRGADLYGANLYGADLMSAKFYGKGGTAKIKKSQVNDFFKALGIIVDN